MSWFLRPACNDTHTPRRRRRRGEGMADFDWVTARSACSLATIFEQLKMDLQADVEKRQALREEFAHYGFKVVNRDKRVAVVVEGNGIYDSVLFDRGDTDIVVVDKDNKIKFTAK